MMKLIKRLLLVMMPACVFAQQPKPSAGTVIRFENYLSQYVKPRTIDVWLPPGYVVSKKYAVLYMNDGQMMFDSSVTWNKQEWQMDEHMAALLKDKKIMDCIVVAVHNTDARQEEYFPWKPVMRIQSKIRDTLISNRFKEKPVSDNYLLFLTKELKPFIDQQFPTYKDQRHTFIGGSSMGGLIALYALCEYPKIFYGAACLSTHWPGVLKNFSEEIPAAFIGYLENRLPDPETHRIYFDYGSRGYDAYYKKYQRQVDKLMKEQGYNKKSWLTQEFPGDDHTETAWANRLETPLGFLLTEPEKEDD